MQEGSMIEPAYIITFSLAKARIYHLYQMCTETSLDLKSVRNVAVECYYGNH